MNIVFATTCKGRVQHLERTLPANLRDNPGAKFVVLSYNDGPELANHLASNYAKESASGQLTVYSYFEPVPFRMAHAKNMAHRCAILEGADVIVNLDADNFTGPNFAEWIRQRLADAGPEAFIWPRMVKEGYGRLPKGISGRIGVTRTAFLLSGGYDEKYETHSPDDKDFDARLRRLGFERQEIPPRFLNAILHNDKMRFREYPEARKLIPHGEDFDIHPTNTVVNMGNVGCGTVYRNFCPQPIKIDPLPTRVWGIGMHKTATTSLHHAFGILGIKSAHWQTAPWAKRVWREVTQNGQSAALERFYAACDLPIPLIYQQLDKAYPGSKFVLTVRDEWKWLKSVANHWRHDSNPFRCQWDSDVFTHRVHNLLYGRKDFDATTMLERYRRHNDEVVDYFKSRTQDLLVMDMDLDCGRGWEPLCKFLKLPVPSVPYPHKLKTGAGKDAATEVDQDGSGI